MTEPDEGLTKPPNRTAAVSTYQRGYRGKSCVKSHCQYACGEGARGSECTRELTPFAATSSIDLKLMDRERGEPSLAPSFLETWTYERRRPLRGSSYSAWNKRREFKPGIVIGLEGHVFVAERTSCGMVHCLRS